MVAVVVTTTGSGSDDGGDPGVQVRMQSAGREGGGGSSLLSFGSKIFRCLSIHTTTPLPRPLAPPTREEGARGLWRGGAPTAHRAAVVAGVQVGLLHPFPARGFLPPHKITRKKMERCLLGEMPWQYALFRKVKFLKNKRVCSFT